MKDLSEDLKNTVINIIRKGQSQTHVVIDFGLSKEIANQKCNTETFKS